MPALGACQQVTQDAARKGRRMNLAQNENTNINNIFKSGTKRNDVCLSFSSTVHGMCFLRWKSGLYRISWVENKKGWIFWGCETLGKACTYTQMKRVVTALFCIILRRMSVGDERGRVGIEIYNPLLVQRYWIWIFEWKNKDSDLSTKIAQEAGNEKKAYPISVTLGEIKKKIIHWNLKFWANISDENGQNWDENEQSWLSMDKVGTNMNKVGTKIDKIGIKMDKVSTKLGPK